MVAKNWHRGVLQHSDARDDVTTDIATDFCCTFSQNDSYSNMLQLGTLYVEQLLVSLPAVRKISLLKLMWVWNIDHALPYATCGNGWISVSWTTHLRCRISWRQYLIPTRSHELQWRSCFVWRSDVTATNGFFHSCGFQRHQWHAIKHRRRSAYYVHIFSYMNPVTQSRCAALKPVRYSSISRIQNQACFVPLDTTPTATTLIPFQYL
jgi:hypothetical protein